jgi:hypothetical protein
MSLIEPYSIKHLSFECLLAVSAWCGGMDHGRQRLERYRVTAAFPTSSSLRSHTHTHTHTHVYAYTNIYTYTHIF